MLGLKIQNALSFMVLEPMVTWYQYVVLIEFFIPLLPVEVLALANADLADDSTRGDLCFLFPPVNVVDHFVADIMGKPLAV